MGGDIGAVGVQIVDKVFSEALDAGASDIHLQPERTNTRIRLRIDGQMHQLGSFSNEHASAVLARIKLAANMHIDRARVPIICMRSSPLFHGRPALLSSPGRPTHLTIRYSALDVRCSARTEEGMVAVLPASG